MKPNIQWPLMIVGFLAIPFVVGGIAIAMTAGDPSFSIEPDYYQKAVNWDQEVAQRGRNKALGWRVQYDVTLAVPTPILTATLVDAKGAPVTGADVTIHTSHNARGNAVLDATLAPTPGGYAAPVALKRPGLWQVRLSAKRGTDTFTDVQEIDVMPGARGDS